MEGDFHRSRRGEEWLESGSFQRVVGSEEAAEARPRGASCDLATAISCRITRFELGLGVVEITTPGVGSGHGPGS